MTLPRGRQPSLTTGRPSFHGALAYLFVGSAILLHVFGQETALFAALWLLWAAALGLFLHRSFGPVFMYDVIRSARRGSLVAFRCIYALILLVVLYFYFYAWASRFGASWLDVFYGTHLPIGIVSAFNNSFFLTYLAVQFVAVLLVTPVYAAGVVTEEKEHKTLEYILATDVGDSEFVLGKLAARMGVMALLLASGLPVLALLQLLGGVDPNLLLAGFAMTFMVMLSLASLSVALSVRAKRTIDAVFGAYFYSVVFMLSTLVCLGLDVNLGNPLAIFWYLAEASDRGRSEVDVLWEQLAVFCEFHLVFTVLLCRWAVWRLRSAALELERPHKPTILTAPVARQKPPIGARPLLWKEIYADGRLGKGWLHPGWLGGFAVFVYGFALMVEFSAAGGTGQLGPASNLYLRPIATGLLILLLLVVSMVAAGKISSEREGMTLDGLLTAPLSTREILMSKLLGAVAAGRPILVALLVVLALGVVTGGLHFLALPLVLWHLAALIGFFAVLGLAFSQRSTTIRATIRVLIVFLVACLGPWVASEWVTESLGDFVPDSDLYGAFLDYLISPWRSFHELVFSQHPNSYESGLDFHGLQRLTPMHFWGAYCSPSLYCVLALGLWFHLCYRFDRENHRLPRPVPSKL